MTIEERIVRATNGAMALTERLMKLRVMLEVPELSGFARRAIESEIASCQQQIRENFDYWEVAHG